MPMPDSLSQALERLLADADADALKRDAQAISERYRARVGEGARLLTTEREAAAYAASRMPATYAAVCAAFALSLPCAPISPKSLLDVGAGPGTASWAVTEAFKNRKDGVMRVTCLEREAAMRSVGQALMRDAGAPLCDAQWLTADLAAPSPLPPADLVCAAYVLGELTAADRDALLLRLWEASQDLLVLVEPGTPAGFSHIQRARALLRPQGAHVAAPCPDGVTLCPLSADDWCHFTVRVQRTRLHRALKQGAAPFEDEKFCFLALCRRPPTPAGARILRHPLVHKGHIELSLCTAQGLSRRVVTKKDKPVFRAARDAKAGSPFELTSE